MADQILPDVAPILDADGSPVAGGYVIFYVSGTTTLATVYADSAGTIPLENPLPLNAAGRAAQVFITASDEVAAVIRSATGATIRTIDPCPRAVITGSAASAVSFSPVSGNPATDVQTAIAANTAAIVGFGTQGTTGQDLFEAATPAAARTVLGLGGLATLNILDEDNFASDSATRPPSQQSVKAYIPTGTKAALNATGSAPIYAARAYASFTIAGGAVTGFSGGNVASVTWTSTGDVTVAFTTAMPNADYTVAPMTDTKQTVQILNRTTGGFAMKFRTTTGGEAEEDPTASGFVVFG